MNTNANPLVLHRAEAERMVIDLREAIGNLIGLSADMSDDDKAFLMDQVLTLQIKSNILEGEIALADDEAAEPATEEANSSLRLVKDGAP